MTKKNGRISVLEQEKNSKAKGWSASTLDETIGMCGNLHDEIFLKKYIF